MQRTPRTAQNHRNFIRPRRCTISSRNRRTGTRITNSAGYQLLRLNYSEGHTSIGQPSRERADEINAKADDRFCDFERVNGVPVFAYDGNVIEMICDPSVEQVRGECNVDRFLFTVACMAITLEEIETSYVPISSDERLPAPLPRFARGWRP